MREYWEPRHLCSSSRLQTCLMSASRPLVWPACVMLNAVHFGVIFERFQMSRDCCGYVQVNRKTLLD